MKHYWLWWFAQIRYMIKERFKMTPYQEAIKAATKSTALNKHGAVIYNKNKILATGHNSKQINPILQQYGYKYCYLHAESHALLKLGLNKCKGKDLIVIRLGPTKMKNSKPCEHCMAMIKRAQIHTVYYTNKNGQLESIRP